MRRALADRIEDSLNGLLGQVQEIITENRDHVLSLAHALETHKTLTGDDVVAVIERQPGPFVDGRPYADPAMIRELEDYHDHAAAAHRAHGKIALGMPEIPKPVLAASGPGNWLVAPDSDPLGVQDGNGRGRPRARPGRPAAPDRIGGDVAGSRGFHDGRCAAVPRFHRLTVLRRLPHPGRGFTQGLIAADGVVWESTGLYGQSTVRRYRLGADQPDAAADLPPDLFGEGICRVGPQLWQLTWRERVALRWDPGSLTLLGPGPLQPRGLGHLQRGLPRDDQ